MSIENPNIDMKTKSKKNNLSDRNNSIRNTPKPKYLTHSIVEQFIKESVADDDIKESLFIKLKKCPDGALQNFIDNFEKKIASVISEMSPKKEKESLQQITNEVTIEDMIALRKSLSEQSIKEFESGTSSS